MVRYEYHDDKSSKFWEARVAGETLTVRFGRIGTSGQTKDKSFANAAAAQKEYDKLVKEKTGKGYVAAGESAAPAPAAQPKAEKPIVAKPAAEAEAVETPKEPVEAPASATTGPSEEELFETFRMMKAAPLPTRMNPAGEAPPVTWSARWARIATYLDLDEAEARRALQREERNLAVIAASLAPQAQAGVDRASAELKEILAARPHDLMAAEPKTLSVDEAQNWVRAIEKAFFGRLGWKRRASSAFDDYRAACEAFADWTVATQGARAALELFDAARMATSKKEYVGRGPWRWAVAFAFRAALSRAGDAEFDAALKWALKTRNAPDSDFERDVFLTFVLADDRPGEHALQPLQLLAATARQPVKNVTEPLIIQMIAEAPFSQTARFHKRGAGSVFFSYKDIDVEPSRIAATARDAARRYGELASPTLQWLFDLAHAEEDRRELACFLLDEPGCDAGDILLPLLNEKPIRDAFDRAQKAHPRRTFALLLTDFVSRRAEPTIRGRLYALLSEIGPDVARAIAATLGASAQSCLDDILASTGEPAPRETWPNVLAAPPWRDKRAKSDDIVLTLAAIPTPFEISERAAPEESMWMQSHVVEDMNDLSAKLAAVDANDRYSWKSAPVAETSVPPAQAGVDAILDWLSKRLIQLGASNGAYYAGLANMWGIMHLQPEPLALLFWSHPRATTQGYTRWENIVPAMLNRFGERAAPGLGKLIETDPAGILPLVQKIDAGEIAPPAARALLRLKKARAPGRDWLRAHPRTAIYRLIPQAVGAPGQARDEAEHALRWLNGLSDANAELLREAVREYALFEPRVEEAVQQVLTRDPLKQVPAKIPKLPTWLGVGAFAAPKLRSGGALPDEARVALCEMLSFVNPDDVYPGVAQVKDACDRASLANFAHDLFSAWLAAGAPSKDGWAMRAMGWIGDDECARKLTRLVRKWPGEGGHARAVTGLDVLCDIGTDVALMNLNGIAEKLKFKGLQEKAREKIAAIAEARDLTPEELADRLAPDLELDERGGLDLDFGPRQFRVGFDEFLKPWVKDATGARIKDLPKPNKSDDPEKSAAASARWSALKKDARAVASLQITRLENMLGSSRRAKPDVFWTFFASHPLIRHLTQRLVWAYDEADGARTLFRVTDDLSLTNAADDAIELDMSEAAQGMVGLAHPLEMSDDEKGQWGALFGDYEILQPFPQLGRETFALTEDEKTLSELSRFEGIEVESKRLRGMPGRGWRLGEAQDGGGIWWIERAFTTPEGEKIEVWLSFEDGLVAGGAEFEEQTQKLKKLSLQNAPRWGNRSATTESKLFGDLGPVIASELLRDITTLAQAGK